MNKVIALLALLSATAAHATTVKIETVDRLYDHVGSGQGVVNLSDFRFEVNRDLTRVRVDIYYSASNCHLGGDSESGFCGPNDSRVPVKGLTYDAAASRVVFTNDAGKATLCANVTVRDGRIFGRRIKVKNTGLCTLSSSVEEILVDDGWETHRKKVLNIFLNVQD